MIQGRVYNRKSHMYTKVGTNIVQPLRHLLLGCFRYWEPILTLPSFCYLGGQFPVPHPLMTQGSGIRAVHSLVDYLHFPAVSLRLTNAMESIQYKKTDTFIVNRLNVLTFCSVRGIRHLMVWFRFW